MANTGVKGTEKHASNGAAVYTATPQQVEQNPAMPGRSRLNVLFGPGGPLAQAYPGFVPRAQQLNLARAIERSLVEGRPCLGEAGTGTGKSLAYLVPLMRYLQRHNGRAVISTHTLALQAQLIDRDIPTLMAALPDLKIRPAVLKGRQNFLCLQDLDVAAGELWAAGDPLFIKLQRWSRETETGDVAELDFPFPTWSDIAANQDTCRARECRYFDRCFYYKAKKEAEDANLIVVNHALFFTDLRLRRMAPGISHLLPDYDAVVFDEAHHVEEIATRAFGLEWGGRRVPQLVARAKRISGVDQTRLAAIEAMNQQLLDPFVGAHKAEAFVDEALSEAAARRAFEDSRDDLCSQLNALTRELTKIADAAEGTDKDKAAGLARLAGRVSTELTQVTRPDEEPVKQSKIVPRKEAEAEPAEPEEGTRYFRWYHTRRAKGGHAQSTLVRTPLDIGPLLRDSLFAEIPRAILVSATLSTGGDFEFVKGRLGLVAGDAPAEPVPGPAAEKGIRGKGPVPKENDTQDETSTIVPLADVPEPLEVREGSPFDFARNCLIYVPRHLGGPTGGYGGDSGAEDYATLLSDEVLALVEAARGRTFCLFTSHRMLTAVYERLQNDCDYPLFVQGEMSTSRLVEAFVQSGEGVLLGAASFWEGVDVPGPALSCVILDKLPFASPDAPTQRAREQSVKEAGGDSFRDVSLPQAAMRLKQGFGRLLRTPTDRGVVAILDNRLWTKGYGREMLADLPPCPRTQRREDVLRFFEQEAALSGTVAGK